MTKKLKEIIGVINGFRKYSIMAALIALAAGFRIIGLLTGGEMVELLRYTVVAFMATNGLEHMTSAVKEFLSKKVTKK